MPEINVQKTNYRYLFSLFLAGCVVLLILAGGLVTSHQAGLAVPDWPLSYGQLFPPMVGNIFWEHGHRMIAGMTGILTLVMAVWTQKEDKRPWVRRFAWICFGTVVLQALLGGLTVLLMLPDAVSIFHACLAQTFLCLITALAYFLSPAFSGPALPSSPALVKMRRLSITTAALIYLQLILGAAARHMPHTLPVILHAVNALAVLIFISVSVRAVFSGGLFDPLLTRAAAGLGILSSAQFFLGIGSFVLTRMIQQGYAPSAARVIVTAAHQSNGAWILALSVFMILRIWKK